MRTRALIVLAIACVAWGLGFPLTKALVIALETRGLEAPMWQMSGAPAAVRFAMATLVFLVLARGVRRVTREEWAEGALLGLFAGTTIGLHLAASRTADASAVAFLSQLYTVLVVLLAALAARRWPHPVVWLCLALVVSGAAVLSGVRPGALALGAGEMLVVLSAFTIAAQIHVLGLERYRRNDATRVSLAMCACATGVLSPALLGRGFEVARVCLMDPGLLGLNLILGLVVTGLLFWLMNRYQPEVSSVEAGMIYTTKPIYASLGAMLLPPALSAWLAIRYAPEPVTMSLALGGALILGANVVLQVWEAQSG